MEKKKKRRVQLIVLGAVFFLLAAACWVRTPDEYSQSERRKLAQRPEISAESLLSGQFASEMESYGADQFPLREQFRSLKAVSAYGLFLQRDHHDIYLQDGYAAQILYPLRKASVINATDKFRQIYERDLQAQGSRVFSAVIPDKGYFLAAKNGYPALDYERLFSLVREQMDYARYVNLTGKLQLTDYYRTDTHWRQEKLLPVAETLLAAMDAEALPPADRWETVTAMKDFRGVYYGQSALPLAAEPLYYLTNPMIEACCAYNFETDQTLGVYDEERLAGRDPYDVFLSGAAALIRVDNPAAKTQRELIIFRDSFGSALAPLLVGSYRTVTLVDLRYVQADFLPQLIDFHGQDVLFLYGTAMLNDSYTFK